MNPADIAAEVLSVPPHAISGVERIKGGLTNESWSVRTTDDAVVVRISTADEHALQIDRLSEAKVLDAVERAGIGAQVLLCKPERRLLVTRHLPGRTWTPEDAIDPANVVRLGRLIRQLHAITVVGAHHVDLLQTLQGYWDVLDKHGYEVSGEMQERRRRAARIAATSAGEQFACFCHNDIHHLNLIDDGARLWLVDWEYAGIGDPLFDLASVCCYHSYDRSLRRLLLSTYLGNDSETALARLDLMCWLFDYVKELWMTVRQLPGINREGVDR